MLTIKIGGLDQYGKV